MNDRSNGNSQSNKATELKRFVTTPNIIGRLAEILPRGVDSKAFAMSLMAAVQGTPALLDCPRDQLVFQLVKAAHYGLPVDGVRGYAYIIPYKGKPTMVPGYKGLMKLAKESGAIRAIEARIVRDGDEFTLEYGTTTKIVHRPKLTGVRGEMIGVYAVATLNDHSDPEKCTKYPEWMTREDVEAVRRGSPAGGSGPWVQHFDEMARKTVIRRCLKYVPAGEILAQAIAQDERFDAGLEPMPDVFDAEIVAEEQPAAPAKPSTREALEAKHPPKKPQDAPSAPPDGPPTPEEQAEILAQEEAAYKAQQAGLPGMRS